LVQFELSITNSRRMADLTHACRLLALSTRRTAVKITELKVHVFKCLPAEPLAFSQGWAHQRCATLVELITDMGLVGWGWAIAQAAAVQYIAALPLAHHSLFATEPVRLTTTPAPVPRAAGDAAAGNGGRLGRGAGCARSWG
jgi:L-alanine-DL-glutamate epimerase-like enolase superfamily enzyme